MEGVVGTTAAAASKSKLAKRVRNIFDIAMRPPPISDPDPANPVPFSIRKHLWFYRMSFYLGVTCLAILVLTTPHTYLVNRYKNEFRWELTIPGWIILLFVVISHWVVTGSDPGYLPTGVAIRIGEENAQHDDADVEDLEAGKSSSPSAPVRRVISSPKPIKIRSPSRQVAPERPASSGIIEEDADLESSQLLTGGDAPANRTVTGRKTLLAFRGPLAHSASSQASSSGQVSPASRRSHRDEDDSDVVDEDDDEYIADDISLQLDDEEPNEALDETMSGIPTQRLPVRAKYCRKSRLVVATYDHHCNILNTTIGERNRARFWLLLFWSTIEIAWLLGIVHTGFGNSPASVSGWFYRNGHALVSTVVCWLLMAMIGGLFIFHTFLMLANVTTYEFMRADKVTYLSETRDFDLPFSLGIKANIKFYFYSDSLVQRLINRALGVQSEWRPHIWPRPRTRDLDRNSTDICSNIWENRYWSCC